ncbi:MAG: enoyl-CoA hydratase/isomerase family protein [Dehalococcoidia bacterium]|nr:enoyl-CoA hydratase/isomerase family protein [Dehalococcoidia bacterium]
MADATQQDTSEEVLLYRKTDNHAVITLNRPDVLNVFNRALLRATMEALETAAADEEVRAVIITGAGRAFSAGGDLTQRGQPQDDGPQIGQQDIGLKIWGMPKPVIAAVRGHAVGGACEIVMMTDIIIAAEDAQFGEPQIRHGGGLPALVMPWNLGIRRTKALILTGEIIDAQTAERYGLVHKIVPNDRLLEEAEALAERIAAMPEKTVRSDKLLINRVFELLGFLDSIRYRDNPAFADITQGPQDPALRKLLDEQGWEAFIKRRDEPFKQS